MHYYTFKQKSGERIYIANRPRKGSFACDDEAERTNIYKYASPGPSPGPKKETR